ncbi:coagulation factor XIII B chain-like isoform X2 [Hyla sarda]|uniref:coagulation factor XIII B chain-like isoform X2 n=1 Tax=Hyla sarda TaxID=327740 RepID=UPI0024C3DAA3|nr:coagulation factor XIII B chain-like isoform X2 [Hyla sarda]
MPRPALIIGMVSLSLCCFTTTTAEKVNSMETTTQLHVNVTPVSGPKCSKPPRKENTIFLGNWDKETYPHGDTVTYSCRPGYIMSRKIKLICLEGKWEKLGNGYCIKRSCGHPGDIPYGTFELRYEEGFVFGAVVEYSCDQGFQMVSRQTTRTCAANGWTNEPPHCEARLCPPVWDDSVQVLTSVTDDEFTMGHAISFKCRDPRRTLKGPPMIFCTEHGTWDSDPPTCKNYVISKRASCTVQENDMRKNNIQLKDNNKLRFEDNENIQFECVSRHNISDPTKLMIHCNNGILKYPTCNKTARLCPPVWDDSVQVLTSVTDEEFTMGHAISFKCRDPRRTLKGPPMIFCTEHGTWNSDPPTCKNYVISKRASCTVQKKDMRKNNIQLKDNNKLRFEDNENIQFECVSRHNISDPTKLMIQCNNGILKYPTCNKTVNTPCGRPPQIKHGEIVSPMRESYRSGSKVKYVCPYLYKLQGPKEIRCQSGTWEDPPVCFEPCTTSEEDMRINHLMLMSGQSKIYCVRNQEKRKHAQKCYVSHNGKIKFKCLPGYKISDPRELISQCDRGVLPYPRCF